MKKKNLLPPFYRMRSHAPFIFLQLYSLWFSSGKGMTDRVLSGRAAAGCNKMDELSMSRFKWFQRKDFGFDQFFLKTGITFEASVLE